MTKVKTNVMRILDKEKIEYNVLGYDNKDGKIDGIAVAEKIGKSNDEVYKTLVTKGTSKNIYVFVIEVHKEIDFKKAAKAAGEKSIEMTDVKDLLKLTGYIRGGCSPIGMKKKYKTFVNESAKELENIVFSGGKIGIQIEMKVKDFINIIEGEFYNIEK